MDEKNYKSIIQEYEELLTLVEVVKNDLPVLNSFRKKPFLLLLMAKKKYPKQ